MSSLPGGGFVTSVVMQNKIYILDATCGLVYDPIDGTWESGELGTTLKSYWYKPCCVIEDLLYSFDPYCLQGSPINVYDPNVMVWTPMMGTGIRAFPDLDYFECKMANFGGKLMVFGATYNNPVTDTWCIEMALIKGETGPILGMINSMVPVLRSVYSPYIDLCRSVTF
ncbi:putative F-box/kelch-repeat protein [Arabidopsis thaliana]